MIAKVLNNSIINILISLGLVCGTLLCIFTPDFLIFKSIAYQASRFMMLTLVMGLFFLSVNQSRLLLVSLLCCGSLALFLKSTTTSKLKPVVKTTNPEISIANINLSSITYDVDTALASIMEAEPDIVVFLELTPLWKDKLNEVFTEVYPFHKLDVRIDPFGIGVYSKEPFNLIDTFLYDGMPNIIGSVKMSGMEETYFIASHLFPPLNDSKLQKMDKHLEKISAYIKKINGPVLSLGEFNSVAWSDEIQTFKSISGMQDSRRGGMPPLPGKSFSLFNNSLDYIFHSNQLNCLSFRPIADNLSGHLGIFGSYQLNAEYAPKGS